MKATLIVVGLATSGFALSCLIWSIRHPQRRLWPTPNGQRKDWIVWPVTFACFGSVVALAILEWGLLSWPHWFRYLFGGIALFAGHALMMPAVHQFGYERTSGAASGLIETGFYKYSRNPQYSGDILILAGWVLISASPSAMFVALAAISVFLLAPFAEEPWMEAQYGAAYRAYKARVRRFI